MAWVQAFFTALPVMKVWRLAEVAPPSGATWVSAQVTWMFSIARPSVSAATAAAMVEEPCPISAAPTNDVYTGVRKYLDKAAAGLGRPVLPMP